MDKKVVAQYEAIRRSSLTNMMDRHTVQRIANENDFFELVLFAEDRSKYIFLIKEFGTLIKEVSEEDIPKIIS